MKKIINELRQSKILLYAIVGISFFAFWLLAFAFVIGDINVMSWEQGNRFFILYCWFSSIILSAITIESR